MNQTRFSIVALAALFAVTVCCQGQTRGQTVVAIKDASGKSVGLYRESHALVIGVSKYTAGWPSLESVEGETQDIKRALESTGFSVRLVTDPDNRALKAAFEGFIDDYGYDKDNRLLFYFSGHGYSARGSDKGYLVPTNAPDPNRDERGFKRRALPMSQILAWCRQMDAKHALFLFDSCFAGTVFKTKALPKVPPHISILTSRPVRQFITAGDSGQEVPAKSVFAPSFIRALRGEADLTKDGYVTGSELGMYLREKVIYYQTGQTPQYGKIRDPDLDEGDFVFQVDSRNLVVKPTGAPKPAMKVASVPTPLRPAAAKASKEAPFENSLGMKFVPVTGTNVLFSIWETRVQDYAAYAEANAGVNMEWKDPTAAGVPVTPGPTHPVVNVSWEEAQAFCQWLTEKERREGRIPRGASYRLPTDLEWSVAVGLPRERGATPRERSEGIKDVYPWGKEWPPPKGTGNYDSSLGVDSYSKTSPVGSFSANSAGLYDLGGNVWEWCEDWSYSSSKNRVLRGGSWDFGRPDCLLSSYRTYDSPGNHFSIQGFRVVLAGVSSC